ncbi:MAG: chromate resistance protein, partial [Nitrososphaera sp.]|nr:chromate resistance protein [Nitrososphaera sp.]
RYDLKDYRGRTWATREHIHIDRLCSSWLIKRFIDPKAKFVFAPEPRLPANAIHFDTVGGEFSHRGEDCTFETLLKCFRIKNRALESMAEIIHDIDMKDRKFNRPEAAGLDAVVRSLSAHLDNDMKVVETGSVMLDALYERLQQKKSRTGYAITARTLE